MEESKKLIRLYNDLCNVEKERRKEILKEIHYDKEKDVKSSIGRITWPPYMGSEFKSQEMHFLIDSIFID